MISSKRIYSTYFKEYILDDAKLKHLQDELLKILLDIDYVCKKHDIKYMITYGTLLGAVRHKGFIPWDDDIDILMFKSEAQKLITKLKEEYPERYMVAEPFCDEQYVTKNIKIFKRGTQYVEIPYAGLDRFDMLFIDIFLIENVPANKLLRKMHTSIYNFFYKAASVCVDYKYPSPVVEEKAKENKEVADFWKTRKRLGCFFSHVGGMKFYLKLCAKIANKKRHTGWIGVPSTGDPVENYPEELFADITTVEFCGYEFPTMARYEECLAIQFGPNYMQIPDPSRRECHTAYKMDF